MKPVMSALSSDLLFTPSQQGDHWFWTPGDAIHPLSDLVDVYHKSVGSNAKLELDFAIDRTGNVAPAHAAAYAQFGAWIRSCYGTPVAMEHPTPGATIIELDFPGKQPALIDRIMMTEDLSYGQNVNGYTVEWLDASGLSWNAFSNGITIGNKRIDLGTAVNTTAVRLTVVSSLDTPHISTFAAFAPGPCAVPKE